MDILKRTPEIKLEHGSGGALSRELIEEIIYPIIKNDGYSELLDAAELSLQGPPLFTTDTFVVDPPVFPGGDIGKLAVFGTCNDVAVAGGHPRYLSMGMVLEEGFPVHTLVSVLESAAGAAAENGVRFVTGDTKVVPRGKGGGIFLNTAGIGEKEFQYSLSPSGISPGDEILISGPVGSHGITILAAREKLPVGTNVVSDCAFLYPLCKQLFAFGEKVKFIRDATRGGAAAILNEIVFGTQLGIDTREEAYPVLPEVASAAEILGLNPLEVANEGVLVTVVSAGSGREALREMRKNSLGEKAAIIGTVTEDHPGRVVLETSIGGRRILDFPRGLLLPRIC